MILIVRQIAKDREKREKEGEKWEGGCKIKKGEGQRDALSKTIVSFSVCVVFI